MFKTACIGYFSGFSGFLLGTLLSLGGRRISNRVHGALMGFSAGLLIAFVCFEMLPEVFLRQGVYVGIIGIVLGTALSAYLEGKARSGGMVLGFAVMFHGLPEGMALGSLLSYNYIAGMTMAAIIALHSLPEALVISSFKHKENFPAKNVMALPFLLALPIGLGAMIGGGLNFYSGSFSSMCLAFAGGVMIYVSCGEILPEARELWRGRLTTVSAALGFVCGIFFTTVL